MNIKDAKEQIKNAMTAYFTKDEFGEYKIPPEKQRPVFLMGPPGIGKTAIMEQIAQELNVGIVSYSMTHHTRQSALGLPYIKKKSYGGKEYSVSEYTMSEIIASVYDMMEETGVKEGILFLDEINCVSETLAPSMLQFLQYKIFGRHKVPDGWIVVTAGNPPEYNNSVREFDTVTWDRLKRVDIEPDFEAWREFAFDTGVHASILSYLDIKKTDFYKIETSVDGKTFVTARGWSDLSDMIYLYEENGIKVDEKLVSQYLQNRKIAKDFAVYYDLFQKYRADYRVDRILAGECDDELRQRARTARFDERLSLLGLLLDGVMNTLKKTCLMEQSQTELLSDLKNLRVDFMIGDDYAAMMEKYIEARRTMIQNGRRTGALSADGLYCLRSTAAALENGRESIIKEKPADGAAAFMLLKNDFDARTAALRAEAAEGKKQLSNVFKFCEDVFTSGQEMLILVTELTVSRYGSRFIGRYGCDEYFAHNKELLFYERQKEIITEMESLEIK